MLITLIISFSTAFLMFCVFEAGVEILLPRCRFSLNKHELSIIYWCLIGISAAGNLLYLLAMLPVALAHIFLCGQYKKTRIPPQQLFSQIWDSAKSITKALAQRIQKGSTRIP